MVEVYRTEVFRHAQVHDDILRNHALVNDIEVSRLIHTIGSCGTGRAEISTFGSAAIPAELSCQTSFPSEIQPMYLHAQCH